MFCPECGEQNKEDSLFCKRCGTPLTMEQMPTSSSSNDTTRLQNTVAGPVATGNGDASDTSIASGSNDIVNTSSPKKNIGLFVGLGLTACVVVVLASFIIIRFIQHHDSDDTPNLQKEGIALFFEDSQVLFGKDNKLHMRVRVPKPSSSEAKDSKTVPAVTIKDEQNKVLATIGPTSMQDTGDGYVWAEAEVSIPATESSSVSLIAESDGDSEKSISKAVLPVVREGVEPVPAGSGWLLAEVCDWADENCRSEEQSTKAAEMLVKHLEGYERIQEVRRYGSTVMFTERDTGVLYCISLEPLNAKTLGTSNDHTFSNTGVAIREFALAETNGKIDDGNGITAGNAITNGNILLLEPTPELMDDASAEQVRKACEACANLLNNSKVTIAQEDDALKSLLRGDVYDAGILVLRAHGIGGNTPLYLMQSRKKDAASGWDAIQKGLHDYIGSFVDCTIQDPGTLFCGLASDPQSWRCAVTACMGEEKGSWNVGVTMAPGLLRNRYSSKPLDNCMIWLSVCGGLSDDSLESWATEKSYGVGILAGYQGAVSQVDDAQHVKDFLTWLTSSSVKASSWRCMNAGEAIGKIDDVVLMGNANIFAKGMGRLTGKVVDKEQNGVDGATITAWRYFNEEFSSQKEMKAGKDGTFAFEDLPCGRYVIVAKAGDQRVNATIVLDEDSIDGGLLEANASSLVPPKDDSEPEPTVDLGVLNESFAADTDSLYLGIGSNGQENGTQPKPRIVRMKRADESDASVIWEGPENGYIHDVLQTKDRLVVQFSSWGKSNKIYSMKKSGEEAKEIGATANSTSTTIPMVTDGSKVVYALKEGKRWVLRSSGLDGSTDISIYEWAPNTSAGNASLMFDVLGIKDDVVYFYTSNSTVGNANNVVVGSVPITGGTYAEVMKKDQVSTPVLVGKRLYFIEGNEFVSYTLTGEDRKTVATLPSEAKSGWLWNMNSRYAFILSNGGTWRVHISTGETEKVGGSEQFATMSMVDDTIVASFIDDSKEIWDLNLKTLKKIWPNKDAKVVNDSTPTEEPLETPEPPDVQSPSSAFDPIAAIEAQAGAGVAWSSTDDYDGDGTNETFALVGEWYGTSAFNGSDAWSNPTLWFASSDGNVSKVTSFNRITYVNDMFRDPDGSGYSLLSLEKMNGTSSSASNVFGVKDGRPIEIAVSGSNVQLHDGQIIISRTYFAEGGGRHLDWHSLSFDPVSFTLIEGPTIADTGNFELP